MAAAHELPSWIRLADTAGVGPDTARRLLAAFGLPDNIFAASHAALREVVSARIATALLAPPADTTAALIARTQAWVGMPGNHVLTLADGSFPQRLLEIADPPILLYAKGRIDLLSAPSIAVVGSRSATGQGLANAEQFSHALTSAGWSIISGLALGIDTAAHRGSLAAAAAWQAQAAANGAANGADGQASALPSTVAVIGTGADIVYPARNRTLAHEIADHGCIISEYPLGMPAMAGNFPRRNRIISGLSQGVLVIEAAARSGSLITARMAAEQGRDVFAIPGSIHSPLAKGCHQLIKQGAKLVEAAQDILDEMQCLNVQLAAGSPASAAGSLHQLPRAHADEADQAESARDADDIVLQAIGFEPVGHDTLAERCGLGSAALAARLLTLELQGWIELLPGGAYQRLR